MNKKIILSLMVLCLTIPLVFGTVYVDDLTILGPGDTFQFQIYTYSNTEKSPVMLSIYKANNAFSILLEGLSSGEIEQLLANREARIHYQIPIDSSWQRESFPVTFFKDLGGYICKFSRDGKVVYSIVERTDINGVAIDMGSYITLEVWHTRTGEKVSFGDLYTGFEQNFLGSLSDPLLEKIEKKDVKNGLLIIKTPSGNAIVHLDEKDLIKDSSTELIFLSEKPLYRPGENINLKGYFYNRQTSKLTDSGTVTLTLTDPMGIKLKEQTSHLDSWGGFEFNYETVDDSVRGHYDFTVQYNDNNYYRYVELSDYQKPEFTIEVDNIKKTYCIGQTPECRVKADYYYGQPLQSGQVHVKLDLLPDYEKNFSSKTIDILHKNLTKGTATGSLAINADGIEDYSVEFTVLDQSGREVSEQKYFKYIPSNAQIKSTKWQYWHYFGQLVQGSFWLTPIDKDVNIRDRSLNFEIYRKGNLIMDETRQTDANGQVDLSFDPVLPGYYTLKVIDSEYPKNIIEKTFFVYDGKYSYTTNEKLELIAGKEVYKPSE